MTAQNLDESPELIREQELTQAGAAGEHVPETAMNAAQEGDSGYAPEATDSDHEGEVHEESHDIHEVPPATWFIYTTLQSSNNPNMRTLGAFVKGAELTIYSGLMVLIVALVLKRGLRKRLLIPGRFQNAIEFIVEAFDNLICSILGRKHGRRFLPFLGTLFIFIILNNYMGMIPLFKAPTSSPLTTFALSITVFIYVQFIGIQLNGPVGYVYHLMGSPKSIVEWAMTPLMFPLHLIGELIKPVSLALRLMGNIMGEDVLIFICAMLGTMIATAIGLSKFYIGIPLQLPVFFLSLLLGGIQALVFMLLSTIYIFLMLPHEHEEEH